jgi:hypothetical protein
MQVQVCWPSKPVLAQSQSLMIAKANLYELKKKISLLIHYPPWGQTAVRCPGQAAAPPDHPHSPARLQAHQPPSQPAIAYAWFLGAL